MPDGRAGLAAFAAAPQPYDMLLTDLVLPGPLNGKALADEVVRRWPATKVVFVSGYAENTLSAKARSTCRRAVEQAVPQTRPRARGPPGARR